MMIENIKSVNRCGSSLFFKVAKIDFIFENLILNDAEELKYLINKNEIFLFSLEPFIEKKRI